MDIVKYYECISVKIQGNEYICYLRDIIDYIQDYFQPNCIITDIDGLCGYINYLSDNGDILDILKLLANIEEDITDYNYIIISNGLSCWRFNDMYDLNHIFNINDIVQDMINRKMVEDYCELLDGF